ncbi:MAG: hypothetical protein WBC14_06000 [Propionicimonas sp.]
MRHDIAAFGMGAFALAVAAVALWAAYGQVNWTWLTRLTPILLIGIAISMLALSRHRRT